VRTSLTRAPSDVKSQCRAISLAGESVDSFLGRLVWSKILKHNICPCLTDSRYLVQNLHNDQVVRFIIMETFQGISGACTEEDTPPRLMTNPKNYTEELSKRHRIWQYAECWNYGRQRYNQSNHKETIHQYKVPCNPERRIWACKYITLDDLPLMCLISWQLQTGHILCKGGRGESLRIIICSKHVLRWWRRSWKHTPTD
jgi:hypothetical protein